MGGEGKGGECDECHKKQGKTRGGAVKGYEEAKETAKEVDEEAGEYCQRRHREIAGRYWQAGIGQYRTRHNLALRFPARAAVDSRNCRCYSIIRRRHFSWRKKEKKRRKRQSTGKKGVRDE